MQLKVFKASILHWYIYIYIYYYYYYIIYCTYWIVHLFSHYLDDTRLHPIYVKGYYFITSYQLYLIPLLDSYLLFPCLSCFRVPHLTLMFMCSPLDTLVSVSPIWHSCFRVSHLKFMFPCPTLDSHVLVSSTWHSCFRVPHLALMFPYPPRGTHVSVFPTWHSCFRVPHLALMFPCLALGTHASPELRERITAAEASLRLSPDSEVQLVYERQRNIERALQQLVSDT